MLQQRLGTAIDVGDLEAIRACVQDGADLATPVDGWLPALHYACRRPSGAEAVHLILQLGADVNGMDMEGSTAVAIAAPWGCASAIRLLAMAGANVNAEDPRGYSPLSAAVFRGRTEVVRELVTAGADVNGISQLGGSLVYLACRRGDAGMVRLLADLGADCSGSGSLSPLSAAMMSDCRSTLLEALIAAGVDATDIQAAERTSESGSGRYGRYCSNNIPYDVTT